MTTDVKDASGSTVTRQTLDDMSKGAGVNGAAVLRMTVATDDGLHTKLGEVQASPTANTVLDRLKALLTGTVLAAGSAVIGKFGIDQTTPGTTNGVVLNAGTAKVGTVATRFFIASFGTLTRPANTTAYSANDAVSNNSTAASVTAQTATVSDTNDDPISLERLRVISTDTGLGGVTVQAWMFSTDPTANSGVGGGDNSAFSQKSAGFIGTMTGSLRAMSDGAVGVLTPDEGSRVITTPVSGAKTIYILWKTLGAFIPSGNSTTIAAAVEGFQGRT